MAAVNSVQGGLRLPLSGIASSPRLLMCSASMGAEGSVTLQLREAVEAPDSSSQIDTTALTIGYSESDIIADMLGSIQAAGTGDVTNFDILDSRDQDITNAIISKPTPPATSLDAETVTVATNGNRTANVSINSSSPTTTTTTTKSIVINNISHRNAITANTNNNNNNNNSVNNNNVNNANQQKIHNENVATSAVPVATVKKSRPKTTSPTRHGPQQCQVCSKIFGNASALAKHKLTHSDERKYVCGMCSKAFKRQDHLNGHMLTHRNKKPYECKAEGCGKSYCDARSLRRHTENHHSSLAMTPTTPNQSLSSTGPLSGLSLSPATASGDASSPHGSNCTIQFNGNGGTSGDGSKSTSPCLPASSGNEGLTRQQLDLISQIMQQTKANAAGLSTVTTTVNGQKQIQRPRTWNMQTQLQQNQTKSTMSTADTLNAMSTVTVAANAANAQKLEQKPVECNLCHRKFKNIPALNGHMRLHGGYFKKDTDAKKCDKKETTGPPLQTASVGIRALIEEKIISKRGKELKGAFVVPAAPVSTARRSDSDNFVTPKTPISISGPIHATIVASGSSQGNAMPKTIETKDATLIELLKRGTKVAVKRSSTDTNGSTITFSPATSCAQSVTTAATVLLTNSSTMSTTPMTPTSSPPLAISLSNGNGGLKSTPLALTISQSANECGDVYTLAYSTDSSSTFFNENDVYNVPDTAMLLQAVDSIQLLHNSTNSNGAQLVDDLPLMNDYTLSDGNELTDSTLRYTPSRQLQAVLNSPLPESLAEFSALHSKDFVLYSSSGLDTDTHTAHGSPLSSPLSYPTPPASHEGVTQSSPFLDDGHNFSDTNSFFDDKKSISFLDDSNLFKDPKNAKLTDDERILKLKHELFNESKVVIEDSMLFKQEQKDVYETKASDILAENNNHDENIDEFNQNLSFLDESQNFLEDARNTSSPLSAAFFSGTMSSAEEVKEALEEVLPNENIPCEQNNDIDLYYLPSLALQSQMMLNSDDPLLSSSPKDFANKHQIHKFDFNLYSSTNAKKPKLDHSLHHQHEIVVNKKPVLVQSEPIVPEIFLSPSDVPHTILSVQSKTNQSVAKEFEHQPAPPPPPPASVMPSNAISKSASHRPSGGKFTRKYVAYKSKLRKLLTSHYTPAPMLNPERTASGLYSTIAKNLINDDVMEFEFSEGSPCVPEFSSKSKVNIGLDFQANVPAALTTETESVSDDELLPLWTPDILQNERQIQRFVDLAKSSAVPLGCHSEEMALKALQEANGETHIAVLSMLQQPASSIHKRWHQSEVEVFLKGLEEHGKDFYKIAREIPTKTTGDCVQFYYFWKKLCVDYKCTHLNADQSVQEIHSSSNTAAGNGNTPTVTIQQDIRPHVCEMPDCSASFTSKAALHGHTRIHCIGRNSNASQANQISNGQITSGTSIALITKEDFPCKVCGKVFNKVKSRSAHMKSHRSQDSETSTN